MVVGEPSLMGGEFGDEDERLITRLENTQYDASSSNSVTASVMGIPGASGSVSSVGGNDNMPLGSSSMLNGEQLFSGTNDCSNDPGIPTSSGNVLQSNSNGLQQQQNWTTTSGLSNNNNSGPNTNNNGQQGNNPVTVGSVSGGNVGNSGPPPCSSNSIVDSISSGGIDKKSPASACIQQH